MTRIIGTHDEYENYPVFFNSFLFFGYLFNASDCRCCFFISILLVYLFLFIFLFQFFLFRSFFPFF